jgi:hypothetical protein
MREIQKDVEQLGEACRQISKKTPTGARLALLLTDNLVELLMYKKVTDIFLRERLRARQAPKYSDEKKRKEELQRQSRFSQIRDLSQDEAEVLKVCHGLRNEAYHIGVIREPIIVSVSATYFCLVCALLPRM